MQTKKEAFRLARLWTVCWQTVARVSSSHATALFEGSLGEDWKSCADQENPEPSCHACAMLGSRLHLQAMSSFCQNQDLLPTEKRHALLLRTRCDTGRNLLSEGRWGAHVSSSSKLLQQRTWWVSNVGMPGRLDLLLTSKEYHLAARHQCSAGSGAGREGPDLHHLLVPVPAWRGREGLAGYAN